MLKRMTFVLALSVLMAASSIAPAFASHRTTVCGDVPGSNETITGGSVRKVLVPENASCTLSNVTVEKDVVVLEGGRLSVLGSDIGDDLRADKPGAIRVDCLPGGGPCDPSSIEDDIQIDGTTGVPANPSGGNFDANYICNGTHVGGDVGIEDSAAGAPWQIGGGFCDAVGTGNNGGGNVIEDEIEMESNAGTVNIENNDVLGDVEVEDNTGAVTVRNNDIGDDLVVRDNTGGVIVELNRISDDLRCDDNDPAPTGGGNTVGDDARGQCSGEAFTATPPPSS